MSDHSSPISEAHRKRTLYDDCVRCGQPWPCEVGRIRTERDEARAQLAAITAAIGDPEGLNRLAKIMRGIGATLWADHIGLIADAASLTPTPTPDHDGHTIDVGPVTVHDDRCPTCGHYAWPNYACPDAWHNSEAT